jgi:hypothetical protein
MNTSRRPSLALLVVVAVAALVVGSLGTAVAGPALTKGKVKKIAVKVVNKKAKSLSVASAVNASNLGGQPPAAYLTESHEFRIPGGPAASVKTFVFPGLPVGSYLVQYSLAISTAAAVGCSVEVGGGATADEAPGSSGSAISGKTVVTGSGALVLKGDRTPRLVCSAETGTLEIRSDDLHPSTMVFTKVGSMTSAIATPTLSSRVAR